MYEGLPFNVLLPLANAYISIAEYVPTLIKGERKRKTRETENLPVKAKRREENRTTFQRHLIRMVRVPVNYMLCYAKKCGLKNAQVCRAFAKIYCRHSASHCM